MASRSCFTGLILALTLTACDINGTISGSGEITTSVRVLNVSTANIDLLQNQATATGNADIPFASGSLCMTVDITSHGLSVVPTGVNTSARQLPSFSAGERYLVTVTGTAGLLGLVSFRNSFTPTAGKGGIRLVNLGGSGSYDIFVTAPGAALGSANATDVITGTGSTYFEVPTVPQQVRLTTTGSTLVAFDVGNVTVPAGGRAVVVLAAPATGTTSLRPFIYPIAIGGC